MVYHKIKKEEVKEVVEETVDKLAEGEIKVIAMVKLMLNYGKLTVEPGDVIILGPTDREQGVNIDKLLENRGVVPFESKEQAEAIKKEWDERGRAERESFRYQARAMARRR